MKLTISAFVSNGRVSSSVTWFAKNPSEIKLMPLIILFWFSRTSTSWSFKDEISTALWEIRAELNFVPCLAVAQVSENKFLDIK